jgi:hypothetical protein
MPSLFRFRTVALGLALVAAQGCKDSARDANRAADRVVDKEHDLNKAPADRRLEDVADSEVRKKRLELFDAAADFEAKRNIRIAALRSEHAVIASQPMLISTMVESFPLTDRGRADVNEKLTIFQLRLDESGNLIQGLNATNARTWKERNDAASEAMNRLEDARKDAWKALEDAPRTDRSS